MKNNNDPYKNENIFYAIHSIDNQKVINTQLSIGENQGIYIAKDIFFLSDYINQILPGKNKALSFYINLNDVEFLCKSIKKRINKYKQNKIKTFLNKIITNKTKKVWGYMLCDNIRKVKYVKAYDINDIYEYFEKKDLNVKIIFCLDDIEYIKNEMYKVKFRKSENYNFIVG